MLCSGSYDHFCFFCHIEDSTKKKDDFAFFIFFTFKGTSSPCFRGDLWLIADIRMEEATPR